MTQAKTEHHILNLGAGVQSTTLYLMACLKEHGTEEIERAVFADTGDEPAAVYRHVEWLEGIAENSGIPIVRVSAGHLSEDLKKGENSTGQRFASIPAFTLRPDGAEGRTRRQCSREYKVDPINKYIRRELLGLKPRQRKPKNITVWQYFGFSYDEAGRAERMRDLVVTSRFPLIDRIWRRRDCIDWVNSAWKIPHELPRSACVYCPYHSNEEWRKIRSVPEDWEKAVAVDESLRIDGNILNRNRDQELFVHRSCKPLVDVNFDDEQLHLWDQECEGGCTL